MPVQQRGEPKTVCVIGGGIAGLVAAYELQELGHDVTLLEATDRFGGRIRTHHFKDPNYYGEFGAMRIPLDHLCTWKYVIELGLQYHDFVQYNANAYFHLRGKRFRQAPWQPLQAAHPGLYPDVRPEKGDPPPGDVLETVFRDLWSKLPTPEERWDVFNPAGLRRPTLRRFDRYSVWQHAQGILPPPRPSFPWSLVASALAGRHFNDEEWEYIGRSTGMLWREKVSYLEHFVNTEVNHFPYMGTIVDGMERLPEALKASLTNEIQLDSAVTEIAMETPTSVRVSWSRGRQSRDSKFQYVICAVPAGATARIQFDEPLPAAKYEALTNLSYQSAAKSLVFCSQRRWEQNPDGIFGGGSRTDMEIQECWYPSDNAIPHPNPNPNNTKMMQVSQPDGTRPDRPVTRDWVAKDPRVSDRPDVLIAAYMTGTNARRFASLTKDQRDTLVISRLDKLHPGIKNDIVEIEHHSWDNQSNPGGGAWATFEPGERGRYQEALVAPYPTGDASDSRVFSLASISGSAMAGCSQPSRPRKEPSGTLTKPRPRA